MHAAAYWNTTMAGLGNRKAPTVSLDKILQSGIPSGATNGCRNYEHLPSPLRDSFSGPVPVSMKYAGATSLQYQILQTREPPKISSSSGVFAPSAASEAGRLQALAGKAMRSVDHTAARIALPEAPSKRRSTVALHDVSTTAGEGVQTAASGDAARSIQVGAVACGAAAERALTHFPPQHCLQEVSAENSAPGLSSGARHLVGVHQRLNITDAERTSGKEDQPPRFAKSGNGTGYDSDAWEADSPSLPSGQEGGAANCKAVQCNVCCEVGDETVSNRSASRRSLPTSSSRAKGGSWALHTKSHWVSNSLVEQPQTGPNAPAKLLTNEKEKRIRRSEDAAAATEIPNLYAPCLQEKTARTHPAWRLIKNNVASSGKLSFPFSSIPKPTGALAAGRNTASEMAKPCEWMETSSLVSAEDIGPTLRERTRTHLIVTDAASEATYPANVRNAATPYIYSPEQGAGATNRNQEVTMKRCFVRPLTDRGALQTSASPGPTTPRAGKYSSQRVIERIQNPLLPSCRKHSSGISLPQSHQDPVFLPCGGDHTCVRAGQDATHRRVLGCLLPDGSSWLECPNRLSEAPNKPTPRKDSRFGSTDCRPSGLPRGGLEIGSVLNGGRKNVVYLDTKATYSLPARRAVGESYRVNPFMERLSLCIPKTPADCINNRSANQLYEEDSLVSGEGFLYLATRDGIRKKMQHLSAGKREARLTRYNMGPGRCDGMGEEDVVRVGHACSANSPYDAIEAEKREEGFWKEPKYGGVGQRSIERVAVEDREKQVETARVTTMSQLKSKPMTRNYFFAEESCGGGDDHLLLIPNLLAVEEQESELVAAGKEDKRRKKLSAEWQSERKESHGRYVRKLPPSLDLVAVTPRVWKSTENEKSCCLTEDPLVTFGLPKEPPWEEAEVAPLPECGKEEYNRWNEEKEYRLDAVGLTETYTPHASAVEHMRETQKKVPLLSDLRPATQWKEATANEDKVRERESFEESSCGRELHLRNSQAEAHHLEPDVTMETFGASGGKREGNGVFFFSVGEDVAEKEAVKEKETIETQSGASEAEVSTEGEEVSPPLSTTAEQRRPSALASFSVMAPETQHAPFAQTVGLSHWSTNATRNVNVSEKNVYDFDSHSFEGGASSAVQAEDDRASAPTKVFHNHIVHSAKGSSSFLGSCGQKDCPLPATRGQQQPVFHHKTSYGNRFTSREQLPDVCGTAFEAAVPKNSISSLMPRDHISQFAFVDDLSDSASERNSDPKRSHSDLCVKSSDSSKPFLEITLPECMHTSRITQEPAKDRGEKQTGRLSADAAVEQERMRDKHQRITVNAGEAETFQSEYRQPRSMHVPITRERENVACKAQKHDARVANDGNGMSSTSLRSSTAEANQRLEGSPATNGADKGADEDRRQCANCDTLWLQRRVQKHLLQQLMEEHTEVRRLLKKHKEEMEQLLLSADLHACAENEQQLRLERQLLLDLYLLQEALDGTSTDRGLNYPPHLLGSARATAATATLRQSVARVQRRKLVRTTFEPATAPTPTGSFSETARERPREICTAFRAQGRAKSFTGLDPVCVVATLRRMKEAASGGVTLQKGVPVHPYLSVKGVTAGGLRWDDLDRKLAHLHNSHTGCLRWKKTNRGAYLYGNTQVTLSVAGGKLLAQHDGKGEDFRRIWNHGDRGDVLKFMAFCDARIREKNKSSAHHSPAPNTDRLK